ncbi:23S rRNA (adenine(1618)-N(6))-methyltransferase RlmF [Fulvivirgaceae bacterium PWU37]|uniref:Ribosomal RNA large subunit methyltransferase F n=1 Tax=Dawidia soli TaxID=2782352 RepID=A0AAP2DAM5_9BACT|nr:23S rRNA (adenine(1618)-N(6))-methyltransferase RlmF [Dawidia soli]
MKLQQKKEHPDEKPGLHPRNRHRKRYNFHELVDTFAELAPFVRLNEYEDESIDFSNPAAVVMLNRALLKHYYDIDHWNLPSGYLCPPVPGRADYIHHIADLLGSCNGQIIPVGSKIKCLDIGVGANCIYPIIGNKEYGWFFIGSDIEPAAIKSADKIVHDNLTLRGKVELRLQRNTRDIFRDIIQKDERFDLTICNPPFHASLQEARSGSLRKVSNLNNKRITTPTLNFGGTNSELWCEGGEEKFVRKMINESKRFSLSCFWFSTLISKSSNLKDVYTALKQAKASEVRTIPMSHGNKISRIVAWTFLTPEQQRSWVQTRWDGFTEPPH